MPLGESTMRTQVAWETARTVFILLAIGVPATLRAPAAHAQSCSAGANANNGYGAIGFSLSCQVSGTASGPMVELVGEPAYVSGTLTNGGTLTSNGGDAAFTFGGLGVPINEAGSATYNVYPWLFSPLMTATNTGTVSAQGSTLSGLVVTSTGAAGVADQIVDDGSSAPNNHYMGRNANAVSVTNGGSISLSAGRGGFLPGSGGVGQPIGAAILARSDGGAGTADATGDRSNGPGGDAGSVTVTTNAGSQITLGGSYTAGIAALSVGGQGPGYSSGSHHNFDSGGNGSSVTVTAGGSIAGAATGAVGIYAASTGGVSGATDSQYSLLGGNAGPVKVTLGSTGTIAMSGDYGAGVVALSTGGLSWYEDNGVSSGHQNGSGSTVVVTTVAGSSITTSGELAIGVLAVSTGGNANTTQAPPVSLENGGSPNAVPTSRAPAGNAGAVTVSNGGSISTQGDVAIGLAAVSSTGGRGAGLMAVTNGQGTIDQVGPGSGSPAGVTVTNTGSVTTTGSGAIGILGLSVGGSGGVVDTRPGILNLLGSSSSGNGASGGAVTITSSGPVGTTGAAAIGILAESVGGGGGTATGTGGIIAVGTTGGDGGNGGIVQVTHSGTLSTAGDGAIGLLAHSIGGGGGNGGNATGIAAAVSGAGGGGGLGGSVTLGLSNGSISTGGDFAAAVVAQSIGGGGGNGGYSKTYSLAALSAAIGGNGGAGSSGGTVQVTAAESIVTTGQQSFGVLAHSVGGGGGIGGSANTYQATVIFALAVDVGGSGGAGAAGGAVTVDNQYHITTSGPDAIGIVAQSVGGGGGSGGAATAKSLAVTVGDPEIPTVSVDLAVGGKGGSGSQGGIVSVSNTGIITTGGDGAHAILAQSIGGGGGNGGDSTASAYAIEGSSPTFKLALSLGGSGGISGNGGSVNVTSQSCPGCQSLLTTTGNHAAGIAAQSIGGGGGNGAAGDASTSSPTLGNSTGDSVGLGYTIGGRGGAGGAGGPVTVLNDTAATIRTTGSGSQGVLAQSIGGGGGNGGGGTATGSGDTIDINVSLGGNAGGGSTGGAVSVTNNGTIATGATQSLSNGLTFTRGGDAVGILAQSVGGGGGAGGSSDAAASIGALDQLEDATATAIANAPSNSMTGNLAIGGSGGTGGNGGSVTVTNTGTISTLGIRAYGILAQSIGGGGGTGGVASSDATSVLGGLTTSTDDEGNTSTSRQTANIGISLGGSGASAGNGGTVSVSTGGSIATAGYGAHAVLAQSIGGGGGVGAEGTANSSSTIGLGVGWSGSGAAGGSGGTVTLTSTGAVATLGDDAYGLVAQSIGGGGGLGGAGCSNSGGTGLQGVSATRCLGNNKIGVGGSAAPWNDSSDFSFTVGGGSGASGNGGSATVAVASGTIATTGARSVGIVAQSIGGGGGLVAGPAVSIGSTSAQGQPGSNAAKGGSVSVTLGSGAAITTTGAGAWGILAQSIGGGGGFAGDSSLPLQFPVSNTLPDRPNNNGAYPDSGTVSVSVGGNITTSGANAHGIFAQAVGGGGGIAAGGGLSTGATLVAGNSAQFYGRSDQTYAGEGMAVTVTQTGGAILASGPGSIGIIAQSTGKSVYTQPITISIGGSVTGGTNAGVSGGAGAAGILVSGGVLPGSVAPAAANTITVLAGGSVATVDGVSGTAITTDYGITNISNSGTITGNILLGRTPGSVTNNAGGTLVLGSQVTAASLQNSGTIRLQPGTTTLTGNFAQSGTGQLTFAFDGVNSHTLSIGTIAQVDGTVAPMVGTTLLPFTDTVLRAASSLALSAATPQTYLFGWNLQQSGTTATITPTANFMPAGATLTASETSVASYLARGWAAADPALAPVFAALYNGVGTAAGYANVLQQASPLSTQVAASTLADLSGNVLGAAMSCPQFEGATTLLGEGRCAWVKVGGDSTDRWDSGSSVSSATYRIGGQASFAPGWAIGGSLATGTLWASQSGGSSSSGQVYDGSVALKYVTGPWLFAASVAIEGGSFSNELLVTLPGQSAVLRSDSSALLYGARLRAAYDVPFEHFYLRPFVDVDVFHLHTPAYAESGASGMALSVGSSDSTRTAVSATMEIGSRTDLGPNTVLRTYVDLGASVLPSGTRSVDAHFVGTLPGTGTFRTYLTSPDAFGVFAAGAQLYQKEGWEVRAEYGVRATTNFFSQGGSLRVAYRF